MRLPKILVLIRSGRALPLQRPAQSIRERRQSGRHWLETRMPMRRVLPPEHLPQTSRYAAPRQVPVQSLSALATRPAAAERVVPCDI